MMFAQLWLISFDIISFFYSNLPLAFHPCHVVCPFDDFYWDGEDDKGGFTGKSMTPSRLSLTRVGIYLISSHYIWNISYLLQELVSTQMNTEMIFLIQTSFCGELGFGIWLKVSDTFLRTRLRFLKFAIFSRIYGIVRSPPCWSLGPFAYQVQVCKLQTVENPVHMIFTKGLYNYPARARWER